MLIFGETGQASRLARSSGLGGEGHLYSNLEPAGQSHAQKLWWTVCMLDQRHSATIGANPDFLVQEQNHSPLSSPRNLESASDYRLWFSLSVTNLLSKAMTGKNLPSPIERPNFIT